MKNLIEILKQCPSGMELDCPMYDNLYFDKVDETSIFPIITYTINNEVYNAIRFTETGCYNRHGAAKCVIFPKGKTTWEGFSIPCKFKDGDVLVHTQNQRFIMSIYHNSINEIIIKTHCILWDKDEGLSINKQICCYADNTRFASEKEKQKLFDAIKDNGYKWNEKTKTLEKLIQPKFKVGNIIKHKDSGLCCTLGEYAKGISAYRTNIGLSLTYKDLEQWELVPRKFDINTLKPFESKVLVRDGEDFTWKPAIFGYYKKDKHIKFCVVGGVYWNQCVPYNYNSHLLGTTDDCDEFYKTW